jgi:hypothetical protein
MFCRLDSPSAVITAIVWSRTGSPASRPAATMLRALSSCCRPNPSASAQTAAWRTACPIATPATPSPMASTATTAKATARRRRS